MIWLLQVGLLFLAVLLAARDVGVVAQVAGALAPLIWAVALDRRVSGHGFQLLALGGFALLLAGSAFVFYAVMSMVPLVLLVVGRSWKALQAEILKRRTA